ncbi:MAG: ribokinase [Candidatus Cryptobacteroides sp.]|nr:ribokinase [Candidatus Cryptobacteroides sp.]
MASLPKILVIGSCNTDMVVRAERLPAPGETILGGTFIMNPGGKGANQAIAASRLGAEVTFISKIGYDLFGLQALEIYRSEKINTDYIFTHQGPSGVALISVDSDGENSIIVAPGANYTMTKSEIDKADDQFRSADLVLLQLEIPLEIAEYAAEKAAGYGKRVILNPAPAPEKLSDEFLKNIFCILPNATEARRLTGIEIIDFNSALKATENLCARGVGNAVITLGKRGAFVKERDKHDLIPAKKAETIDTTGAGDVFCGAFCVYLAEGHSVTESVEFANAAAATAVTRVGAQSSIPYRQDITL